MDYLVKEMPYSNRVLYMKPVFHPRETAFRHPDRKSLERHAKFIVEKYLISFFTGKQRKERSNLIE